MTRRSMRIAKLQENYIKKGRGQGIGSDYTPFIQAHDNKIASEGWLTRHKGWKTGRIHHTLSEHERKYLYFCEWWDEVVDIREQWPLLPIDKTIEIAEQLGIKHANIDGTPVVMTTDFRLTIKTKSGLLDVIRTIKPCEKLTDRTLELFEIERIYFAEQGIDWCIITDNKIPSILVKNIEWLSEAKYLETRPGVNEELTTLISDGLLEVIIQDKGQTSITNLCLRTDKEYSLERGTCMFIMQHMLANKWWTTDMHSRVIKESEPLLVTEIESKPNFTKSIR
ncbi:heteromeric transposase endonuclease subunit TnsA [Paenibacillus polymyxa]|uniref:heteromeric transposase endonuclease subunit TnsA n=2 Tax=Paenibacillus TaxID=44249 RepID=UPI0002F06D17|nr:heteromeric transposase endonuclease subunit TnsA [Paenibacillus polymyxa]MCP3808110.1 heteromeric transposase endonuclease subunit TnsA [Paenibacillus sp. Lou8.1]MEE4570743.1 heteromeric transposase endonuclease subunit TnsA [Paenibacillus polymyxa]NMP07619.1 heteromeric transposase endonuclease subunit TnsA [Paenibacillus polymyxa]